MVDEPEGSGPQIAPVAAGEQLLLAVPRLVGRTVRQAELARSLAAHLPCVGPLLARRGPNAETGTVAAEPVSVLDVFDEEPDDATERADDALPAVPVVKSVPDLTASVDADPPITAVGDATNGASPAAVPDESELAVPDYDSLAASQVVPRLAMLSGDDLRAVLAYEQSHRHRQTILNRVAQLLDA
ncbi:hypothetical protein BH10ACT3_BH10ACT3_09360 [soil metagenome]